MSKGLFGQSADEGRSGGPGDRLAGKPVHDIIDGEGEVIVMLDLNYTTVSNSRQTWGISKDYGKQIPHELYREDLIAFLRHRHPRVKVALVTHRYERFREATLRRMDKLIGWSPDSCHFNPGGFKYVADWKLQVLRERIPELYTGRRVVAIESNSRTSAMYRDNKIPVCKYQELASWMKPNPNCPER